MSCVPAGGCGLDPGNSPALAEPDKTSMTTRVEGPCGQPQISRQSHVSFCCGNQEKKRQITSNDMS